MNGSLCQVFKNSTCVHSVMLGSMFKIMLGSKLKTHLMWPRLISEWPRFQEVK